MKEYLTKEQSKRLLALGIKDPDGCPYERDYEIDSTLTMEENHKRMKESDYIPIFNIYNLLELLPKEIDGEYFNYNLTMSYGCDMPEENQNLWMAYYEELDIPHTQFGKELIDALYELLIWVIENDYLIP